MICFDFSDEPEAILFLITDESGVADISIERYTVTILSVIFLLRKKPNAFFLTS